MSEQKTYPDAREIEDLAGILYSRYNDAVGGRAWNGDILPSWIEFRADPLKEKQSDAWVEVAKEAIAQFDDLIKRMPKPLVSLKVPGEIKHVEHKVHQGREVDPHQNTGFQA